VVIRVNPKKARLGLFSILELAANGRCVSRGQSGDHSCAKDASHIYGEKSSSGMM
jgi:hypothetical protein